MSKNLEDSSSLLSSLREEVEKLEFDDTDRLDSIRRRTKMIIEKVFGKSSDYLSDFKRIGFAGPLRMGVIGREYRRDIKMDRSYWENGVTRLINLIDVMLEDLKLSSTHSNIIISAPVKDSRIIQSDDIFIVHGHDDSAKHSVARCIEKLGLNPIILQEQPNEGKTVIEKLEKRGEVGFAVIILTPDDVGNVVENKDDLKPRARQNVILELGYFIGKLGRSRVCALHKGNVELPSDIHGVIWENLDENGAWQFKLAKELKNAGYDIDMNKL